MQKWLARELQSKAAGMHSVSREEEVDLEKRPDVRLRAGPEVAEPVCIEVKLADTTGLPGLERALRAQLVGGYLRDRRSNFGILFLADRGGKWSIDRRRLRLTEVVEHLNELARKVEAPPASMPPRSRDLAAETAARTREESRLGAATLLSHAAWADEV